MNPLTKLHSGRPHGEAGFTLVELMVTMAIALFLLGGLLTMVQNVRKTQSNQQLLAQLQDNQRFAMTLLTDVIQAGGYYPDPVNETYDQPLVASAPFQAGEPFQGTYTAAQPGDTLAVRYTTSNLIPVILCDGSSNPAAANQTYANAFRVVAPVGNTVPGKLQCSLNGGPWKDLVSGVENLRVYYGVKRDTTVNDYNTDTYLRADQMTLAGPNGDDWSNVSTVRIILTFTNPMKAQPGQAPTILFDRVVQVMARAGVHT